MKSFNEGDSLLSAPLSRLCLAQQGLAPHFRCLLSAQPSDEPSAQKAMKIRVTVVGWYPEYRNTAPILFPVSHAPGTCSGPL